jgi:hypothetical protein
VTVEVVVVVIVEVVVTVFTAVILSEPQKYGQLALSSRKPLV